MYILRDTPSAAGQYEAIQQTTQPLPPPGYLWWPDSLDRAVFDQYEGFILPTIKRGTVASYEANAKAYEAWKEAHPEPEPEPEPSGDMSAYATWDALAQAYREGVNAV